MVGGPDVGTRVDGRQDIVQQQTVVRHSFLHGLELFARLDVLDRQLGLLEIRRFELQVVLDREITRTPCQVLHSTVGLVAVQMNNGHEVSPGWIGQERLGRELVDVSGICGPVLDEIDLQVTLLVLGWVEHSVQTVMTNMTCVADRVVGEGGD